VNAPRVTNSSASAKGSGIAAALNATKRPPRERCCDESCGRSFPGSGLARDQPVLFGRDELQRLEHPLHGRALPTTLSKR
jgi:hypothetical protein